MKGPAYMYVCGMAIGVLAVQVRYCTWSIQPLFYPCVEVTLLHYTHLHLFCRLSLFISMVPPLHSNSSHVSFSPINCLLSNLYLQVCLPGLSFLSHSVNFPTAVAKSSSSPLSILSSTPFPPDHRPYVHTDLSFESSFPCRDPDPLTLPPPLPLPPNTPSGA
jgi:hypothetical protein